MISVKDLVDMVCTEALEQQEVSCAEGLPPIRFRLELIRDEDGTVHWEERD